MEPLYVNHTTMDKTSCRRFLALTWGKNAGAVRYVLWVAGAASLLYGVRLVVQGGSLLYAAAMFAMGVLSVFLAGWGWLARLGRYTAAQQQAWGGPTLEKAVRFYEDGFEQESALGALRFEYKDVTRVRAGKQAMLVEMGPHALYMDAAGFEGGASAAEAAAFVQARRKA